MGFGPNKALQSYIMLFNDSISFIVGIIPKSGPCDLNTKQTWIIFVTEPQHYTASMEERSMRIRRWVGFR